MGEHPTTKLCLLFLREVIKGGERVLDYGTGTGVLGIAALKVPHVLIFTSDKCHDKKAVLPYFTLIVGL
jgi:ribosomal protein L11 methylase PrmA